MSRAGLQVSLDNFVVGSASPSGVGRIEAALRDVERLHPSPVDAIDEDWGWLDDVDELVHVVRGGLRCDGIASASVDAVCRASERFSAPTPIVMSAAQCAALEELANALQSRTFSFAKAEATRRVGPCRTVRR